jgi:hypothetical protein
MANPPVCAHIQSITELKKPKEYSCEECVKTCETWVHLRTCQTCGATLCCNSSPNQHMSKHYHATQHQVITSAEPGERWIYCLTNHPFSEY